MSAASTGEQTLETRTLRKVIIRVVPFLMALYFVNYLDRTNLGIAKADISEHLQLTASMFGLASGIFFIGYVLVEVPSNLALERFGARRWLARIAVSWGIVAVAIGFAPNAATLLVLRFLLGVAEAGLFPGVIFYLTRWFPGAYRARIVAMFMLASPIAAAVGTPVSAWLIQAGEGVFGLAGWQFMMIGVGLPAIILGIICWFYLTDRPADAHWLNPDERQWLINVLAAEEREVAGSFDFPLRRALTSPRIWLLSLVYFGIAYGLYALAFFLPSIISGFKESFGMQLSIVQVGLITAVPYTLAAIAMYLWSRHADSRSEHVWHVAIPMGLGGLAIPVALYLDSPVLVMIPVSIAAIGVFSAIPSFWTLPAQFLTGAAAAGGIGLINSIGNLGGFAAPYATGALNQFTGSDKAGMWAVGIMMIVSAVVVVVLRATPIGTASRAGTLGPNPPVNREGIHHAHRDHT
ncbi:MFS transporter [Mycobacterium sp. CVI_P3]|uniref:MFS transporter n=1 Tax=Mycobacterium pinniadriaticum TaxID=2994102 RepID=A0ABT3SHG7_9MYCO|nr:MFS transporter [Mycobacterium pinniadriaticum]MCX2932596.1 MFS transporter [Mycobacterium pinniadriaticum]MCX2938960.1 MFS transporter [Mycobacterium pinniadriaticum]